MKKVEITIKKKKYKVIPQYDKLSVCNISDSNICYIKNNQLFGINNISIINYQDSDNNEENEPNMPFLLLFKQNAISSVIFSNLNNTKIPDNSILL
jgi:hypothetical protein